MRDANEIEISPEFLEELQYAQGEIGVPAGKVSVAWHREGENIVLDVTVPEGVSGDIRLKNGYVFADIYQLIVQPVRTGHYLLKKI